jgi:hypothetical protein
MRNIDDEACSAMKEAMDHLDNGRHTDETKRLRARLSNARQSLRCRWQVVAEEISRPLPLPYGGAIRIANDA